MTSVWYNQLVENQPAGIELPAMILNIPIVRKSEVAGKVLKQKADVIRSKKTRKVREIP